MHSQSMLTSGEGYKADVPFLLGNLNEPDFASRVGLGVFDLVTSIEVLEHVESPIGFLRNVGHMLKPGGVAVLTTLNVDSTPARLKFLLRGTIRMMHANSETTHIGSVSTIYRPVRGLSTPKHSE